MQTEREKQGGRFFVLIQKLNFIFADKSFNEMNVFFLRLDTFNAEFWVISYLQVPIPIFFITSANNQNQYIFKFLMTYMLIFCKLIPT